MKCVAKLVILCSVLACAPIFSPLAEATVSTTAPRNDYIGTNTTAVYNYTFKVFAATDLRVTQRGTANVETTLVYPTDYTVTGVGKATGGTITLTAGNLATSYALTIRFDRTPRQSTDLRNQGSFFPETHETKFDELTRYSQQNKDVLDRAVHLPETEAGTTAATTLPAAAARASKFLAWDSSGNVIAAAGTSANLGPVSPFINTLLDDTDAAAARATLGADIVQSYTKAGLPAAGIAGRLARVTDNIRGLWMDTGTQWVSLSSGELRVGDFGAIGDDSTDNQSALQAAIVAAQDFGQVLVLDNPRGIYRHSAPLVISKAITIRGSSGNRPRIKATNAAANNITIDMVSGVNTDFHLDGLTLDGGLNGIEIVPTTNGVYYDRFSSFRDLYIGNHANAGIKGTSGTGGSGQMIGSKHHDVVIQGGAYGFWFEGDDILGSVEWNGLRISGTTTAAVHLKETGANPWPNTRFVNPIIEANNKVGFDLYGVKVSLINPHFETNGSDAGPYADIRMDGDGSASCDVNVEGGYFSTSSANQSNVRIFFAANKMTLNISGSNAGAASIINANDKITSSSIQLLNNNNDFTVSNFSGGSFSNLNPGALSFRGGQLQSFLVGFVATAGNVTQHTVTALSSVADTIGLASKISGASTTLQNTPLVSNVVNFTTGVGILASNKHIVLFDVASQYDDQFSIMSAAVVRNSTGTALNVRPLLSSDNVNGTTRYRLALHFANATTDAAFLMDALGVSKYVYVTVQAWVR